MKTNQLKVRMNTGLMKVNSGLRTMKYQTMKHSPEIYLIAGIGGVVVSAVIACVASTKLNDILEEAKDNVEAAHAAVENPAYKDKYSEEDCADDIRKIYVQTALNITKLYAPAIILGTLSITSILASNNVMKKRNAALAAAYTAIDTSFKEYRERVAARFGEDVEREIKYNIKSKELVEETTDESGKKKKTKTKVETIDPTLPSPYAKWFDSSNPVYKKNPEHNLMFLRAQQTYANEKLKVQKYLFLNEVYELLGYKATATGQLVGWVWDKNNPEGDQFVDFGIYRTNRENMEFVNGVEPCILLDFNVQGNILELI